MKKRRVVKTKNQTRFIAVVMKNDNLEASNLSHFSSGRALGDWASFVGYYKTGVIERAMEAKLKWEANNYGPYDIFVGTLTEIVKVPTNFKLTKIVGGAK